MTNRELYYKFQKDPIYFVKKIWKLEPQPIKVDYKTLVEELIEQDRFSEIKLEYFEDFIQDKNITWQQWLILLAVKNGILGLDKKRISVLSGHGIGKSTVLSWIIIWFLFCFEDAQVPCTAPTADQMHDVLWKEIKVWLDRMPVKTDEKGNETKLSDIFEWTTGYLRVKDRPDTWFARARTASKDRPEALAGVHGKHVLFAIDEASGIIDDIFNTAEGSLTGENTMVIMISNGTRSEGYFYESHNRDSDSWVNLQFSSEESPIVKKDFVDRILEKHGVDSDEYRIRVKGLFPVVGSMDDGGWVSLIEDNQVYGNSETKFTSRLRMGVDPAGDGDDQTVWVVRDDFIERVVARERISTSKSIALKTLTLMEIYRINENDVYIDNLGVGANVAQEMAIVGKKRVRGVNWAEKADDEEVYFNKRAECYFRHREWTLAGGMVNDAEIKRQLTQTKFKRNIRGKKQIMEKKDLRKIMKRSPDDADAGSLTFYDDVTPNVNKKPNIMPHDPDDHTFDERDEESLYEVI